MWDRALSPGEIAAGPALAAAASIKPTKALEFPGGVWLEDDGADLPIDNSAYTWEFWVRFTGRGCFAAFGSEGNTNCNGFYFDGRDGYLFTALNIAKCHPCVALPATGNMMRHWWYANDQDLHGQVHYNRWYHMAFRCDQTRRTMHINGRQVAEDRPGNHTTKKSKLWIGGR